MHTASPLDETTVAFTGAHVRSDSLVYMPLCSRPMFGAVGPDSLRPVVHVIVIYNQHYVDMCGRGISAALFEGSRDSSRSFNILTFSELASKKSHAPLQHIMEDAECFRVCHNRSSRTD